MLQRIFFTIGITIIGFIPYAQDPTFDDFERSGGLGPDWTIYFGGGDIDIIGDSDLGIISGPTQFGIASWTASTYSADQYSEGVIAPDKIDSMLTQVFVRRRLSDNARYAFHWGDDNTQPMWAIKYDGVASSETRILDSLPDLTPPVPGDTLRIEVRTDTVSGYPEIKGYHNGMLLLTAIDTEAVAIMDGEAGMAFRFRIGFTPSWPSKAFEEWSGGSLPPQVVGLKEKTIESSWALYPNPLSNSTVLSFENSNNEMHTLRLLDMNGRLVRTVNNITTKQIVIERQELTAGLYIFNLMKNGVMVASGKLKIN